MKENDYVIITNSNSKIEAAKVESLMRDKSVQLEYIGGHGGRVFSFLNEAYAAKAEQIGIIKDVAVWRLNKC